MAEVVMEQLLVKQLAILLAMVIILMMAIKEPLLECWVSVTAKL
jgi:hypothetical protein